ncbi:type VI secretion protein [Massilia sp. KIM]|uniref:type VI secretion system baseplate subunit TssG n=1 Tax=Massilia sp. KIM TaxID=1955422 RepID=UPI00098F2929|nr:type VI secretion system baseplate subunit TssG [Massilia sp. KIM]OON59388.1 type VI secretion protein [Massilia sp. KIM]
MPAPIRRPEPPVIERLLREPWRFGFFQAVRLLELWLRRSGRPQRDLVASHLRFQNPVSLGFPASELEAVRVERHEPEPGQDTEAAPLRYVRLTPAFMGLLGGHGVLPFHYTERIAEHQAQEKDEGARAFLDTFSNRSLALFYAAWRKYRLALHYQPGGQDAFLPLLLSLAGLGDAALRRRLSSPERGAVLDESLGYFAASIRHRPASAAQIGRVLSEYFGLPVEVEQFVGDWYAVPREQQTVLGEDNAVLGARAIAGARVWQRDLRLRLVVGPLDRSRFDAFLPGGLAARALTSLLSMFTGVALAYEIELELRALDVRCAALDEAGPAVRLGWDAFLVEGPQTRNRRDVRYALHSL